MYINAQVANTEAQYVQNNTPTSNVWSDVITYVAKVLNISAKNDLNNNELILATYHNGHAENLAVTFKGLLRSQNLTLPNLI